MQLVRKSELSNLCYCRLQILAIGRCHKLRQTTNLM